MSDQDIKVRDISAIDALDDDMLHTVEECYEQSGYIFPFVIEKVKAASTSEPVLLLPAGTMCTVTCRLGDALWGVEGHVLRLADSRSWRLVG